MLRSRSLIIRFGVVSALLILVLGVVLSSMVAALIAERARRQAEQTAVVAVQMSIAPNLQPVHFERVIDGPTRDLLDKAMAENRARRNDYYALRLKIFNADGMVVYSDASSIVGRLFGSADLGRALRGELVSKLTNLDDSDELGDTSFEEALEVYVPLTYGQGQPVGVAELYLPYAPVRDAMSQDKRVLYGIVSVALLLFYAALFRMVSLASRQLTDQARDLRASAERNDYLAHHDALTGLPNRALLTDRFEQAFATARRTGANVAVLLIDLDRFKEVNDTLGHETGDLLLCQVAERIRLELRDHDTVARLGGDEFVVLLPIVDGVPGAVKVAERVLNSLHRPFEVRGLELAVEASIGVACFPDHGDDLGALLQHADVAMYAAKQARGTYAVYEADSDESSLEKISILTDLRRALANGELTLFYQPKAELCDGTIRSVEALVRWQHPTRGLVAPNDFVPLAEQTGLIGALTEFVLTTALKQVRAWHDEGRDIAVAVNLSARNLMDPKFHVLVESLLAATGVEARYLEVEVTETSAMADPVRAAGVLAALSELGVLIAVDDYGTGFSSLSYLRSLPIGVLKIDRSFVTGMLQDEGNAVIVRSTIELAYNLGLRVVAEGVEDAETYEALTALGCHVAQGYYLSRPVPAAVLTEFLDGHRPGRTTGAMTPAPVGPRTS